MSKRKDNYLLQKNDLGHVKKGFHELPPENHTYGWAPQKDQYGAGQVISGWEEGTKSKTKQGGKDFISMNKDGLKKGYLGAKDITEYRKGNEIKQKVKQGQKFYGVNIPEENFTYGISNRPSTPIKNVISNSYAEEQEKMREEREAVMKLLEGDKKVNKVEKVQKPNVSAKVDRRKEIQHNNFKLSKYNKVESKVKPMMVNQQNR